LLASSSGIVSIKSISIHARYHQYTRRFRDAWYGLQNTRNGLAAFEGNFHTLHASFVEKLRKVLNPFCCPSHVGRAKTPFDKHHGAEAKDVKYLVELLVDPFLSAPTAIVQNCLLKGPI